MVNFKKRSGQMSLLAILGFVVVVAFVIYSANRSSTVGSNIKADLTDAEALTELSNELQALSESALTSHMYGIADEMGAHGGFTIETVPFPSYYGIPALFYRGKKVNVPSVELMEKIMAKKIEKKMKIDIEEMKSNDKFNRYVDDILFGVPEVTIRMTDNQIEAIMNLDYTIVKDDIKQELKADFKQVVTLRLKLLRDKIEQYLDWYEPERFIEKTILNGIQQDERIPSPPGAVSESVDCDSMTVFKEKSELITPMRENAELSTAKEVNRIRGNFTSEHLEWDYELDEQAFKYTFLANEGADFLGKAWESDEYVYFVPYYLPFMDIRTKPSLCPSTFTVSYTLHYPFTITLRDTMPTSQVIAEEGQSTLKPLEFKYIMEPYLVGENPYAVDGENTQGLPGQILDPCAGSCKATITVQGATTGVFYVDECKYPFSDTTFTVNDVPCGVHTILLESLDPKNMARFAETVNIEKNFEKTVQMKKYGELYGNIYQKNMVYCSNTKELKTEDPRILRFVEGSPPLGVEIIVAPVNPELSKLQETVVDANGNYKISGISPGKYLIIAKPLLDATGKATYKVQAQGLVKDIPDGATQLDFELDPINIVRVGKEYKYVTSIEKC